jgi:hypothetical protein
MRVVLNLPAVGEVTWNTLAVNVEVQERAALLFIARLKKEATRCLAEGDREGAVRRIEEAKRILATAPPTPEMQREAEAFAQVEQHLLTGALDKFAKYAT